MAICLTFCCPTSQPCKAALVLLWAPSEQRPPIQNELTHTHTLEVRVNMLLVNVAPKTCLAKKSVITKSSCLGNVDIVPSRQTLNAVTNVILTSSYGQVTCCHKRVAQPAACRACAAGCCRWLVKRQRPRWTAKNPTWLGTLERSLNLAPQKEKI